jgi:tRNA(adenine34) deaminase
MSATDEHWMQIALTEARLALRTGEVPVGAVLVRGSTAVAAGGNRPIAAHDPTAHAEIVALRAAGAGLANYRLDGCTLYVTLEPCIVHARVARLVFGAFDPRAGAAGSMTDVFRLPAQNHRVDVFGGVLAEQCERLLKDFFSSRRQA